MATITTPQVIIIEQPRSQPLRYRYKCEGRSAGRIPGEFSTDDNKTHPTIKVIGYKGKARVIVSCVTKEPPYRPHPHSLVGREGCNNGICTMDIPKTTMSMSFSNLGIQCARRKDIPQALYKRHKEIGIDPFNTGYDQKHDASSLDMNIVRLCFQVFIEDIDGNCTIPLQPIVSEPIYDIKAVGKLVICRLSECTSPVNGGNKDIYLLCKKVAKDNIRVRIFEGYANNPIWEGFPDIKPTQVHEQTAIWFRAPPYKNQNITEPVKVQIQLLRPSDGATSDPRPFQFLPLDAEPGILKRKRLKFGSDPRRHMLLELQNQLQSGASYYNIPPTPDQFKSISTVQSTPTLGNGTQFIFPGTTAMPSTSHQENPFKQTIIVPDSQKILNTMPMVSYSYVENTDATRLAYENYRETTDTTPSIYSPLYENITSPVCDDLVVPHMNYSNIMQTLPNFNSQHHQTSNNSQNLLNKEKIKDAIRAKCKSLQNAQLPQSISNINNGNTATNQVELSRSRTASTNTTLTNNFNAVLPSENQNSLEVTIPNFSNLLDADFMQLENILIPNEEEQYASLNIPMNAMTISESACNLSSLLNIDSSQIQSTISSEQLDNLLAII